MITPKTVKIKRNCHSDPDLTESREKNPFRFEQQGVKKWRLVAAYGLIGLAISAMFIALYNMDIAAETIIFPIRLVLVLGGLISTVLLSILLHLYFRKQKLLEERDRLIAVQIRTLRGLVSVCSHCKKVCNGRGYWEQIEAYVTNNSHVEFSHGICPECMVSLQRKQIVRLLEVAMSADK